MHVRFIFVVSLAMIFDGLAETVGTEKSKQQNDNDIDGNFIGEQDMSQHLVRSDITLPIGRSTLVIVP